MRLSLDPPAKYCSYRSTERGRSRPPPADHAPVDVSFLLRDDEFQVAREDLESRRAKILLYKLGGDHVRLFLRLPRLVSTREGHRLHDDEPAAGLECRSDMIEHLARHRHLMVRV